MSDIVERLRNATIRQATETEQDAKIRRNKSIVEAADEITRLREDLANSLSYRDELVSANEGLGVALSEAEKREKVARRVAIEDCAKVAILTANHLTILPPSVRKFPEVGGIIAARILELSTPVEEKIDEVSG